MQGLPQPDAPATVSPQATAPVPSTTMMGGSQRSVTTQGARLAGDASARLRARSAQLEKSWRELASKPVSVQRLAHTARASRIKARVSVLDASYRQLDDNDYWQRRVALLDALVTAEQAERMRRYPGYDVVRGGARSRRPDRTTPVVFN